MQITRSCCFECKGTFHVLRSEDLSTLRFFWRSERKLIKNIFDIRKSSLVLNMMKPFT